MASIVVSAYNNGEFSKTGAGYGFRIKNSDVKKNSDLLTSEIFLTLDKKGKSVKVRINQDLVSNGDRVVFTSKEIGRWLILNKMDDWNDGKPPEFIMTHLKKNEFEISKVV